MTQRCLSLLVLTLSLARPVSAADGVKFTELPDRVRVEINGELFTEYHFKGAPHVYFHPLIGPGGLRMTRAWPMEEVAGEERDHKHHRGLWFSHGAVNGVDFWAETPKSGSIVHDKFLEMKGGPDSGVLRAAARWVAPGGEVMLRSETTFRVYARPAHERLFDFEVTLTAGDKEVVLGDTKEGTMAVRVAESMRGTLAKKEGEKKSAPGPGRIVLSSGDRSSGKGDEKAWGKRAAWCDYSGPVQGKTVGIAMFDHPSNPRHPTWWHVREYGLFAANPFGVHDFEKKPAGTGNLVMPPQGTLTFKYRFYVHEGDETQAKVAERYAEYIR